MSYGAWTIGNNKQIKYGKNWYKRNNDNIYQAYLTSLMNQLATLLREHESLFTDQLDNLNLLTVDPPALEEFFLRIGPNYGPLQDGWVFENPPFGPQKEAILKNIVNRLLQIGVLREVRNKPIHISPVDIIFENNEWKLWPDYSPWVASDFNLIPCHDHLNFLEEYIFSIPSSSVFTKLVIKDAYFLIPLKEAMKKYTSFKIKYDNGFRYFQFNTLHPNIHDTCCMVRQIFQMILSPVLSESVRVFEDHILICTQDLNFHKNHLEGVLHLLNRENIKLSLRESFIVVNQVELFDFCIDERGVSIPTSMKKKIRDFQLTTSEEELEWFRKILKKFDRFINSGRNSSFSIAETRPSRLWTIDMTEFRGFDKRLANELKSILLDSKLIPFPPRATR